MRRLIVTSGPLVGRRVEFDRELTIGGPDAMLDLHDDAASPRHAVVRPVGAEVQVEDLASQGGTWVDGTRIGGPQMVGDGAVLRVGGTTFIVEIDVGTVAGNEPDPVPPAPPSTIPLAAPPSPASPGPNAAPELARRRPADTRMWGPAAATFATIIATAIALVLYFALR